MAISGTSRTGNKRQLGRSAGPTYLLIVMTKVAGQAGLWALPRRPGCGDWKPTIWNWGSFSRISLDICASGFHASPRIVGSLPWITEYTTGRKSDRFGIRRCGEYLWRYSPFHRGHVHLRINNQHLRCNKFSNIDDMEVIQEVAQSQIPMQPTGYLNLTHTRLCVS
jgi:hypothetical protein